MVGPEEILRFWLDDIGPKGWYDVNETLDNDIRARFGATWEKACEGNFSLWLTYPNGALAYIVLTDQFPRNMFRGMGKAFSSDQAALAVAKTAIKNGWDLRVEEPARQFFYLPLMHSESLCDQDRCVRLMHERMTQSPGNNLLHARAHREVIRQFGRFPYRNDALDRVGTVDENAYIAQGGYGITVRQLQEAA